MNKRNSTFNILSFLVVLALLLRQVYYMNLISSFVISNAVENSLFLFLSLMIGASLLVLITYYLPALFVIKTQIVLDTRFKLESVHISRQVKVFSYVPVQNRLYKQLQVIRC